MNDSYIIVRDGVDQALANKLLDTNFAGTVLEGEVETDDYWPYGIVVHDRETYDDCFEKVYPKADEEADNGETSIRRYDLNGCVVFLCTINNKSLAIYPAGSTIIDYLRDWSHNYDNNCEFFASFGFYEEYEEAEESDTDVKIWCIPNFYAGNEEEERARFVVDDSSGDPMIFASYDDAQEWIDNDESQPYYLSYGEAGRPGYVIVK